MISREKFKEYLGELKELDKIEEELNGVLKKLLDEDNYFSLNRHYHLAVKLLEEAMEDKVGYVSSYIYDTDYGRYRNSIEGNLWNAIDNMKDWDELYDYIVLGNNVKIFVISDTHFNHKNIINYCNRPFDNIYQMNDTMIKNWNKVVGPNDVVFHLGDFGLGSQIELKEIFDKLNGRKFLILGNHDRGKYKTYYEEIGFEKVYHDDYVVGNFVFSHQPKKVKENQINIYGHIHNAEPKDWYDKDNYFCASVEKINYTPIEISKLVEVDYER